MLTRIKTMTKGPWLMDRINALPYRALFLFLGFNIVLFACLYTALSYSPGNGPTGLTFLPFSERFWGSLYYSVITATNTGYGDIVPLGYSRVFAALQSALELFLFALFVSKLVSSRQDTALSEVHKLAFELTFRNIREDLYVARKDFDRVIEIVGQEHGMSHDEWERLVVAYQHIAGLIRDIPNFYDVTSDLYIIDPTREALLLESMQRTLSRIHRTLRAMDDARVDWHAHAESLDELRKVISSLDEVIPLWREHSHDQSHEAFMKISSAQDVLRTRIT